MRFRIRRATIAVAALLVGWTARAAAQQILVPMDDRQADHLKAYGLAYWSLAHGGRIDVQSTAGEGTTFTITISLDP